MNLNSLLGHIAELIANLDAERFPADRIAARYFKSKRYLGSHDRRFISEATFGIVRHRRYLETLVDRYFSELPADSVPGGKKTRYLLLTFAHVWLQPERVGVPPALWKTYFPNLSSDHFIEFLTECASLNFLPDDENRRDGIRYSFQDWMVREWRERFGQEVQSLLKKLNEPASTTLRVNLLNNRRDECLRRLKSEGIDTDPTQFSPAGLIAKNRFNIHASKGFKEGLFELQDEGSQMVSLLADPQPGSFVIDACAGAGGKTLHLADLMLNRGEILAIDTDPRRLAELEKRSERGRFSIIRTSPADDVNPENLNGRADLVLVDAPCSGVGTIRRNPWLKWSVSEISIRYFSDIQKRILDFNSRFVRGGGKLIYATCSLLGEENEGIVKSFLGGHDNFEPADLKELCGAFGLASEGYYATIRPHMYNTDGFFISAFQRKP